MATTSLKLPDALKQRAAAVAQKKGVSPHAFMVDAIEHAAAAAERRSAFVEDALDAREQMLKTGKGFDAQEVHAYIRARIAHKKASRPKARSWQR
jgi:predicted transcriptional regulator